VIAAFLLLRPASGRLTDLVEYYRTERVIEGGLAHGLLRGELLLPKDDPADLGVISRWGSAADYQSWLDAPERARLIAGMTALLDGDTAISGWTREISADAADPDRPVDATELYGTRELDRPIVVVADARS
jgi:heme-degrading monooxygenase HmoA